MASIGGNTDGATTTDVTLWGASMLLQGHAHEDGWTVRTRMNHDNRDSSIFLFFDTRLAAMRPMTNE